MKINLKIVLVSLLFVVGVTTLILPAVAAPPTAVDRAVAGFELSAETAGLTAGNPFVKIGRILGYVTGIATVILIVIVVYGGLTWMTAGGNQEGVSKGRSMIIQGVIGLLITMSAYSIVYFVVQRVLAGDGGVANTIILPDASSK